MVRRTAEERQELLRRYYAGEKLRDIAISKGVNYYTLKVNFRNWGAKMRPRGQRAAAVNEEAFSVASPEAAYWLGFLMADGHVPVAKACRGKQRALQVRLARKDEAHLEKLKVFLQYKGNIHRFLTNLGHPASMLSVTSEKLCKSLESLGCTSRKTYCMHRPLVPDIHLRHWMRGFFDGDGFIFKKSSNPGYRSYTAGFCGLPDVLDFIQEWATSLGLPITKLVSYSRTRVVFRKMWSSHEAIARLALAMYDGATVSLDRKRSLFLEALR